MDEIFKKLNYKNQKQVFVLNAPTSFDKNLLTVSENAEIIISSGKNDKIEFAIGFAIKQTEINDIANSIAPNLTGDAVFWICYPKGTSKKYKCDFNRDRGWGIMGTYNLEAVRQISIDEDWSALRFRKTEYIKTLNRNQKMALSIEGKKRTK